MKYLKSKVFEKLFLNTIHKKSDIKQKPSRRGTWQKQVVEIKINPWINCQIYLPLSEIEANYTTKITTKWLFLENKFAEYDNWIYWQANTADTLKNMTFLLNEFHYLLH
jgi:hypothetical protein